MIKKLIPALVGFVSFGASFAGALAAYKLRHHVDGSSFREIYKDNSGLIDFGADLM